MRVVSGCPLLVGIGVGHGRQQHQPANELERLSAASAQTCLRAIRSQIAIGYTFCNLAKSQLQTGRTGNARRVVEKLRRLAETIRRHLNEPNHVPRNEIEKLRTELEQLESSILDLEERERSNCR